ncbi:hypothetical protein IWW55_001837 [Coemansia sp. RSA 2706]|nr:hypothetical protein LPJ63_003536 [Coemansia sp. RSA 2711]KAJ1840578.1 hypothetical protein LPJ70_004588 [Coemansia sp. RSA 2708]KAJ2305626.1 hypothetical protein IWW55_001837 [Coemansia sp. RSA 2706]KAJ2309509.1 hypothetical protein IWW54_003692 [Coemansia sp. RSA 2705]KAJ2316171.1 hypothetical protein IWW52_003779 [Coemansia sp. RSA 2704]KAJ2327130.1 hypothetical protein IWW51_001916 [Coemansia sp. RSA 2702]KAJ2366769.1 hypothetical protein H4S01_002527 [Coemansia sp. RSA 2610]KAJ239012
MRLFDYFYPRPRHTAEVPANFIDLGGDEHPQRAGCLAPARERPLPAARRRPAAQQPQRPRGISWLDVAHDWEPPGLDAAPDMWCQHCNMRVAPVASLRWHQRLCALSAGAVPHACELCGRPYHSLAHARNHCLYGCTPSDASAE